MGTAFAHGISFSSMQRGSQRRIGDNGAPQIVLESPPTTEGLGVGITNPHGMPCIKVGGQPRRRTQVLPASSRLRPPIARANTHTPGVKSKADAQCFEGAFLAAPEQGHE